MLTLFMLMAAGLAIQSANEAEIASQKAYQNELQANYFLAKAYEEKSMLSFEKGDKQQEETGNKELVHYQKAWLYALEARKLELPNNRKALKQGSLDKLTSLSARALLPLKMTSASYLNLGVNITAFSYNRDGTEIALGTSDNTIQIWSTKTGEIKRVLYGHREKINALSYSLDNLTLASASDDKSIILWDALSGEIKENLYGHRSPVLALEYIPNTHLLASGSRDSNIFLWDTTENEIQKTLNNKSEALYAFTLNPEGAELAVGLENGTIKLWDINSGNLKKTLKDGSSSVVALDYSADGNTLVTSSLNFPRFPFKYNSPGENVRFWDLSSGKMIKAVKYEKTIALDLAYSPPMSE